MAKEAFETIETGLKDALAFAKGDKSKAKPRTVEVPAVDVAAARKKTGLSQDKFAHIFGISPSTLRKWEQGQRHPRGPALVLLNVIAKEPKAVLRALGK
ncbi:helix-turn-helix domain-containing protein [Pelagibius litoralis]|uniref:Helix-turn-helix domain-containing protein n=1 Tax=Pelagibius litoralis TaxID=374515 RepID=A0A967KBZ1_9PROT|nr:helix-turn-helix domain-containing protein [Pelagibius litoralis]NIA72418.1 helix-turn-helix domain-containing protein [Pelagibius litoralis]